MFNRQISKKKSQFLKNHQIISLVIIADSQKEKKMLDFLFPFHIFLKKMALELTMDDCHLSDITKIGIKIL